MSRGRRLGASADLALWAALTVGFALIVFVATGGTDLAPNTWVQIALIAVAVGCAVALMVVRPAGRSGGAVAVGLFAALAALTYLSIAWSVQPATSWLEANRTLSYLAAFGAAAALARLAPARWPALTGAVGAVAVIACGYALLTKVFPGTLDAADTYGRLRVPFDYWNATGLMAAMGLPVCLWAGARPSAGRIVTTLSVPAVAILSTAMILSYSRGALLAVLAGLACWFALAPLRLRGTLILVLGAACGAVATIWALPHHAITHDNATLAARTAAGHSFGLVLLAVVVVAAIVGVITAIGMERIAVPATVRRRIGIALIVLVAMVPVVAVAGAAASSRGLTGQISHAWSTLTSASSNVGNGAERLGQLGNSRGLYWREGLKVGEHSLLAGVGAGGFDIARTRYTTSASQVAHAHSYLIETFADLGLIGLAVSIALLAAWALACRRTLAASTRSDRTGAERTGMITLLAVVVTFGVSSLIDWTWFVPGVAVPALVAAGWLAGRGPLEPSGDVTRAGVGGITFTPGRLAAAIAAVVAAVIAAFFVWQPLHSSDSFGAAITAMTRGNAAAALADARAAADSDPVSIDPLLEESSIYGALQNQAAARSELVKATSLQPENPQSWVYLGTFDLQAHQTRLAVAELETAHRLDLTSAAISTQLGQARTELLSATPARTGPA